MTTSRDTAAITATSLVAAAPAPRNHTGGFVALKPSFYNFYFDVKGRLFIYNALTTAIVELDSRSWNCVHQNNLDSLDINEIDDLSQQMIIVDDNEDELSRYQYYFDYTRYCYASNQMTLMIIPTYGCNLRCPYCYQGNDKNTKKMTLKEYNAILSFIKNKINEMRGRSPLKEMLISIYGGEPLLCVRELECFCNEADEICKANEIRLKYSIITNFTLANDEVIDFLRRHETSIQVSIDGSKTYHDKTRIDVLGRGTYDVIIDNLKRACSKGLKDRIAIRLNVDDENIRDIDAAFHELTMYSDDVYFGMLTHYDGYNDCFDNCIQESKMTETYTEVLDVLYKQNCLPVPRRFGKKSPCALCSVNRFMIDSNMNVYKCDLLINHEECAVGKLELDGTLTYNSNYFHQSCRNPFVFEKCRKCKLMPLCAGGCPARQYIALGRKDGRLDLTCCDMTEDDLIQYLKKYVEMNFT